MAECTTNQEGGRVRVVDLEARAVSTLISHSAEFQGVEGSNSRVVVDAGLRCPAGLAFSSSGDLYVACSGAEAGTGSIRRLVTGAVAVEELVAGE